MSRLPRGSMITREVWHGHRQACGRRLSGAVEASDQRLLADPHWQCNHRHMTMIAETTDLTAAAYLFRSLADPVRLAIVRHLALGEHRVVDLTAHVGLAQSTVSGHLSCLRDCGLVTARAEGRASLYSLARPELLDLLAAAELLLAATGEAVALCPTYGGDVA